MATIDEYKRAIADTMSEETLAGLIEGLFRMGGWEWYHPWKGEKANTTLDYHAWRERLIFVELKTMKERLSRDRIIKGHFVKGQVRVIEELTAAGQEIYVWRPSDLDFAQQVLVERPRRVTIRQECER